MPCALVANTIANLGIVILLETLPGFSSSNRWRNADISDGDRLSILLYYQFLDTVENAPFHRAACHIDRARPVSSRWV